jgi:hypothetical protein
MFSYRKTSLLLLAILAVLVAAMGARLEFKGDQPSSNSQQRRVQTDEEQWPITDYERPLPSEPEKRAKRLARGKKYDKPKVPVEPAANYGQSITNDHWYLSIPSLPTTESNIIVIGEIVSAQSYLSNNRTGVYSEFAVRIERILKDTNHALTIGNIIDVEREGGRVRSPSGQVTRYSINGQNMPRVGKRYLLFLTCTDQEQASHIVTGYELRAGKVFPLDEAGDKFDLYKGVDETELLNTIQEAITNPPKVSPL